MPVDGAGSSASGPGGGLPAEGFDLRLALGLSAEGEEDFAGSVISVWEWVDAGSLEAWLRTGRDWRPETAWALLTEARASPDGRVLVQYRRGRMGTGRWYCTGVRGRGEKLTCKARTAAFGAA